MINLAEISKIISGRTLFEGVTMTFNDGCRYGLTGPNGSGKSTLLKIIMGLEKPTTGTVTIPKKTGFLTQNIEDYKEQRVIDTVIMGNPRLWDTLAQRDLLLDTEEITDEIGIKLAELEEIIQEEEGYSAESAAEKLLIGMGIPLDFHLKNMNEIPVDRQFRILLCQALFGNPDALLLDEPTNHLDLEAIEWLILFLQEYSGTLIVISHDRHFLNTVTTHIADIDYETIIIYPGNYDQMILSKTSCRNKIEAENKSKNKKIKQLQEFVSKFSAGTRASQVQSRLKEIEKLQPAELKKSNIQRPYIRIPIGEKKSAKMPFKIENLSKSYGKTLVFENFSIDIHREDKIACIGNNGEGKSTFLKILAQQISPSSGMIEIGQNVNIGYFPQNHADIIDKSSQTIFDWLKEKKIKAYDQEIRNVLGKMLFSGEDVFKKLSVLSGGESARLILAGLMLNSPNVIILDEPNNHLDLESVSALAKGLEEYQGTIIFASHDRDLLSHVATKLLIFKKNKITLFDGPFKEYFS